jgi:hypothetical protein
MVIVYNHYSNHVNEIDLTSIQQAHEVEEP